MSVLKKLGAPAPFKNLVNGIQSVINTQGDDLGNGKMVADMLGLENLKEDALNKFVSHVDDVKETLKAEIQNANLGFEAFDDTPEGRRLLDNALEAGAIAMIASGNPAAYAEHAYRSKPSAPANGVLVDSMSLTNGQDYRERVALEAFDDRELREHLPYSVAFNVFGQRQDDFCEALYPTTVVTPDQAGIDVTVSRMLVFEEVRHSAAGTPSDFKKRNLLDAAVDYTILSDEHTRLVPWRNPDNSNASYFVASTLVAPSFITVAGVDVETAPLAMNKQVDLLGISANPALLGAGVIDNTDAIDARIQLDAIYLQANAGDPGVRFPTSSLPRNTFVKTVEGNYKEMELRFDSEDIVIDGNTVAVDGSTVSEFALIASGGYTVRLSVSLSGKAQVEFGNVKVWASSIEVAGITDDTGADVSLTAGNGATIKAALEAMSIVGYDLHVNRNNLNRRSRGHLLDTTWETSRYTIPLGSPLSVPSPASSTRDQIDLKTLVTAARIRNSNNAITNLFETRDNLKAYISGPRPASGRIPDVGGMGRFLIQPFFEERTIDLLEGMNSVKSSDRAADVSATLVNLLRDISYRMYRDSYYQAAVDAMNGVPGQAPTLFVGTDQVLARHLMVSGDTRTFGQVFDSAVLKVSLDKRMRDTIVMSFIRPDQTGPDPLTFGTHAWIPELTSSLMVNRNGATIKEAMVQPRTLHINNLPILAVVHVENLSAALGEKTGTPALDAALNNTNLNGINYP